MPCNLLGSTWYARTVTAITAISIANKQSLQNTPPTHSRQHCDGHDLFQSPTVGTTHSRQMNHRMPKSLDPSGLCGGRYRGCVLCGCHIIRLLTYRQYHYSVVLLIVYSSTIILLLFSITPVLSVLLLSCMYVTMILRYSLESTDDNTVPGHASPAKQAISPAVVAPRS